MNEKEKLWMIKEIINYKHVTNVFDAWLKDIINKLKTCPSPSDNSQTIQSAEIISYCPTCNQMTKNICPKCEKIKAE